MMVYADFERVRRGVASPAQVAMRRRTGISDFVGEHLFANPFGESPTVAVFPSSDQTFSAKE